jgi:hypothetical protein
MAHPIRAAILPALALYAAFWAVPFIILTVESFL